MGNIIPGFLGGAAGILYFLLGLVQMAAVVGGVQTVTSLPFIIALPIAFVIGEIPVVGTIAGIYGAMANWGMSFAGAVMLFGLPFVLIMVIGLLSSRE